MKMNSKRGVRYALSGMATLADSEWAQKRIWESLESFDSESEVSKYSDFTNEDILNAALGIQAVYNGSYTRLDSTKVNGTSLHDIFTEVNDTLAIRVKNLNATSIASCAEVTYPYDYRLELEIASGVGPIRTAREVFMLQAERFVALGAELEIGVTTEYDPD